MKKLVLVAVLGISLCAAFAQELKVKIINRQSSETGYSYQVPGRTISHTNGGATCNGNSFGNSSNVNCSGSSTSNSEYIAPRNISYSVTGATLALLLPDGRIAVVNCVSKYKLKMDYVNRRSCREPLVDDVEVDFKGKKAKLKWPVSIDGKKYESETYKVIAILQK